MLYKSYVIFRRRISKSAEAALPLPNGVKLSIWKPSWKSVLPYSGAPVRFAIWWFLDRFGIFRKNVYTVLLASDDSGHVVHRTCLFPGWKRTPFIGPDDVEIGDIWTSPEWRRRGLASLGLQAALFDIRYKEGEAYYLTESENLPSRRLAAKRGFAPTGHGHRQKRLGGIVLDKSSPASAREYSQVTEISGAPVSQLQLERMIQRYAWAQTFCENKVIVDAACGTGQGLGLFQSSARRVIAGDVDHNILRQAHNHYGDRVTLLRWDAQALPLANATVDILTMFEAIYYLSQPEQFLAECKRVLKPGGYLLLSMPNSELFDFHRSELSFHYFSGTEIKSTLEATGFEVRILGGDPVVKASTLQRTVRPLKALAAKVGLIPRTMVGKRLIRRVLYGRLLPLTSELTGKEARYTQPVEISLEKHDLANYRIMYVMAKLNPAPSITNAPDRQDGRHLRACN